MKNKRILVAVMMLCIFAFATAALSSCDVIVGLIPTTHEHELSLVAEVEATCTAEGIEAYYACSGCEKIFADAEGNTELSSLKAIAKVDHSFTNYVSNGDATCTADGTKTAKCDNCDATDTVVDEGSKTAHTFTNYVSNGDATCTADGTKTAKCDNCYKTDTKADEGSKLAHSFTNYVPNGDATCTQDGTKTAKCDNCDATDTVVDENSKGEHYFTNYVSDSNATCTQDGTKTAKCEGCDATNTITDEGTKLAHSFTNYVSDGNATCTQDGTKTAKCDRCDATDTLADEGSKLNHSFTNYVSDENATCTADGTKTAKCDRCDETDTKADEGSKLNHSFTNYVSDENATCTADGTKTAKCDRCDETDTKADEGSAKGHSFTNYVSDENATCTADGTKTAKCDRCDETDTKADEGSAKGHTPAEAVQEKFVSASCKNDGSYDSVVYCAVEGCKVEISRETKTIPATGDHVFATEKEKVAATCEEDGYVIMACGCGEEQRTTLGATGHTEAIDDAVASTCTGTGLTEGKHCSVCNKTIVPQEETPAKGHSENPEYVAIVDATLENEGKFAHYVCPDCNKAFADEACTVEATDLVIPKLSLADYTTTTTVENSVATTVFTLISDVIEYSVSVETNCYIVINRGAGAIYASKYDYQTLNNENVTVTYEDGKGYTYIVAEGATESLVAINTYGASLTLVGEYNITLSAGWANTNVNLIIGDVDNPAIVNITNKGIYMYGADLIVNKGSTLNIPAKTITCEKGATLIIDGTVNAAGITVNQDMVEDASYEYGFIPGLYVRHGVANITGQIKTNSIQVGSVAENAYGILNSTHSDNNILVYASAKSKYVFAAGELNMKNTGSGKTGLYMNTTGGATVDIRSGMTVTVTGGISNMIGTWKAGDSAYVYDISVEEGATINASGINFLRGGKEGALDANVYCWDTVEINVDGEMKKVKVVNVKSYAAGKFSHSLSAITFYTPVDGAVYTTGTETVDCQHLGTFKVATAADGSTIYYQD